MSEPKNKNANHLVDPQHVTGKTRRLLVRYGKYGLGAKSLQRACNRARSAGGYVNFTATLAEGTMITEFASRWPLRWRKSNLAATAGALSSHDRADVRPYDKSSGLRNC